MKKYIIAILIMLTCLNCFSTFSNVFAVQVEDGKEYEIRIEKPLTDF